MQARPGAWQPPISAKDNVPPSCYMYMYSHHIHDTGNCSFHLLWCVGSSRNYLSYIVFTGMWRCAPNNRKWLLNMSKIKIQKCLNTVHLTCNTHHPTPHPRPYLFIFWLEMQLLRWLKLAIYFFSILTSLHHPYTSRLNWSWCSKRPDVIYAADLYPPNFHDFVHFGYFWCN